MGEDDVNVAHSSNIEPICQDDILLRRPKKINRKLFENVDLEAQRIIEQQRIKEERDAKLAEEQAMFAAQRTNNLHPVSNKNHYFFNEIFFFKTTDYLLLISGL